MCALYGFINYGKILSQKELKKLVRRLSVASCSPRIASLFVICSRQNAQSDQDCFLAHLRQSDRNRTCTFAD